MQSDAIIYAMLGVLVLAAVGILFGRLIKSLFLIAIKSAVGVSAIFAVNFLLSPIGLSVGINAITAVFTGVFGFPGFVTLYVVSWILGTGGLLK